MGSNSANCRVFAAIGTLLVAGSGALLIAAVAVHSMLACASSPLMMLSGAALLSAAAFRLRRDVLTVVLAALTSILGPFLVGLPVTLLRIRPEPNWPFWLQIASYSAGMVVLLYAGLRIWWHSRDGAPQEPRTEDADLTGLTVSCLHISAAIYLVLAVTLGAWFFGVERLGPFRLVWAAAVPAVCLLQLAAVEAVGFGLRRGARWAWYAGLCISVIQLTTLFFMPLGALQLWGLFDRRSRARFLDAPVPT